MALPILFAILLAEQSVFPFGPPPVITREDFQAARDKFDRKMKLDTDRPWDGMALTGPHALEKRLEPARE
jgi:hypothetical protein